MAIAASPASDRPFYTIRVYSQGAPFGVFVDVSDDVTEFEFEDDEKKADKLQLKVNNFDLSYFDNPILRKGNIIEFTYGYPGRTAPLRRCIIQKVKGGRVLTVEAHAMSMLMHKIKRSRTFENKSLTEIAKQIAGEYGTQLGPAGGYDSDNIAIDAALDVRAAHRHQAAETDAQFLNRLAKRYGLEFYVDSRGLHFKRRNLKQKPVRDFTWYNGEGDFMDFDIENDIVSRHGAVTMKGFDPLGKKALAHRADNSTKREGLAPTIEIIDQRDGSAHLQALVADESLGHTTETSAKAVQAHAEGKYRNGQQVTVKLSFTVIGDPDVQGKRTYGFRGLGKRISGLYYTRTARHTINSSGYITKGTAITDGHGGYGSNNVASKATLNKKDAGKEVQTIEIVDTRTGESKIEFRRSGEEPKS